MTKIKFKISKNTLTVSILNKEMPKEDLNNTNVIDTKEIIFSSEYIIENFDLVSSFLNVIIIKQNVSKLIVKEFEVAMTALNLVKHISNINEFILKDKKAINYDMFLYFIDNKYIKKIDVYEIPKVLLERLDINKGLEINVRSELFFLSDFMTNNNLNTYSDIYYKKSINILNDFSSFDEEDFDTFINISFYLKVIYINHFNASTLDYILYKLKENNKKNIKIIILEKNNNLNSIYSSVNSLRKSNDKYLKNNNVNFKVSYSAEYKRKNLFKQLNLNFVKTFLLLLVVIILFLIGVNKYKNYIQTNKIIDIENEIKEIIKETTTEEITSDVETTTKSTYVSSYYRNYDKVFDSLLEINSDTKGWITVNNTRVDYPVVQSTDNDYYLNRDYFNYKNSMGWIFMDFRNNIDVLNQNTIIYGHNIKAGIMFGSLKNILTSSWQNNPDNHVITFNTLNETMKWQVISVYKIPETTDYLKASFYDKDEYQDFLNMIVGRSVYNFNQTTDYTDKIITLSTCYAWGDDRVVLHAKLIK